MHTACITETTHARHSALPGSGMSGMSLEAQGGYLWTGISNTILTMKTPRFWDTASLSCFHWSVTLTWLLINKAHVHIRVHRPAAMSWSQWVSLSFSDLTLKPCFSVESFEGKLIDQCCSTLEEWQTERKWDGIPLTPLRSQFQLPNMVHFLEVPPSDNRAVG